MRILFLGFAEPDDIMDLICNEDPIPPIQTHKFNWSLINGMESHLDNPLDIVSAMPISDYPRNPRLYVKRNTYKRQGGGNILDLSFVNVLALKHISRFFSALSAGISWVNQTRHVKRRVIMVYGVHTPFLIVGQLLSRFFGIPVIGIWTDPPGVSLPNDGWAKRMIRNVDSSLARKYMKKMNGCVALTRELAEDYSPGVPTFIMEGIANIANYVQAGTESKSDELENKCIVMYAGGLCEHHGVRTLIEGFRQFADASCRLWLFGRGEMEEEVRHIMDEDNRVIYYGFRSNAEVHKAEKEATVLINPRPTTSDVTKYLFPSKTIEYMLTGTPVITTRMPGITDEYSPYLFFIDDESPTGIADALKKIRSYPSSMLMEFGAKASAFVRESKNPTVQGKRVVEFIVSMFHGK